MISFLNDFHGFAERFSSKLNALYPTIDRRIMFLSSDDSRRSADCGDSPMVSNPRPLSGVFHIVYNASTIQSLGLTEYELWAIVAHEVGHILISGRNIVEDFEDELKCDSYASILGIQFSLATALLKMSNLMQKDEFNKRMAAVVDSIVLYRPEWTCGRYVESKHAAIYYNLITGMCYNFEGVSADAVGIIFNRPRNSSLCIYEITDTYELSKETVLPFLAQLIEIGLIVESPITENGISQYRSSVAQMRRKSRQSPINIKDRLPFEHSNAEMDFTDAVGGIGSVMLELTYNCSEKCIHCYNIGATRNDDEISHRGDLDEMTFDDYKRIIDQLYEQGLFRVCLSGGDPFSKPIVWDILHYLFDKDIAFDIYTNGQRLDGKELRLAKLYPRLVAISVYSAIPEIHDYITRISGSLERSIRVMKRLGDLSVPMNLKCCIMRPNMKSYFTVVNIADTVGAVPQFEVSITDSIEGDKCATRFLRLAEKELEVVLRDSRVPLYVGPEVPDFGRSVRDMSENACGAGYNTFCIRPDGKLIACCSFHVIFGDLKIQSLSEIISTSVSLKKWQLLTLKDYVDCGKYEYCSYCNLCPGNNFSQNGDPRKSGENNCFIAKVRYNLALRLKAGFDVLDGKNVEQKIQEFELDIKQLRRIKG